ncbi:MAG: RagB/SusD family nutrient uptake outer membrane protein [Parabacteroides sp.]|nr:RagB/SusD family nutrient uptake outer membrane protein [Parabacteroides sp.]
MIVCFCSCDDFLETVPQDKVTEENFWQSESDALKFLTDIYSRTLKTDGTGSITYDEAMSDNAHMVWDWYGGQQQVANGTLTSYSDVPYNIWANSYENIRKCYQFLENVERVPELSEDLKNRMLGEVHFMLAYNYNQLVLYFAEVPLVDKVLTVEESKNLTQASKTEVVDFIVSQLDLASGLLNGKQMDWGRITWGGHVRLLKRVFYYFRVIGPGR